MDSFEFAKLCEMLPLDHLNILSKTSELNSAFYVELERQNACFDIYILAVILWL